MRFRRIVPKLGGLFGYAPAVSINDGVRRLMESGQSAHSVER
jgi:hypothetical protein